MGSFLSLAERSSNDTQLVEKTDDSTPHRLKHKRLLDIDPRSPTENISRTPIVVDKTPAAAESRRQIPETFLIDPRSPTAEFSRTPLQLGKPSPAGGGADSVLSGASQSLSPSSDNSAYSESGIESADVTPVSCRSRSIKVPSMPALDSDEESLSDDMQIVESIVDVEKVPDGPTNPDNNCFDTKNSLDTSPLLEEAEVDIKENVRNLTKLNLKPSIRNRKLDKENPGSCEKGVKKKHLTESSQQSVTRSPLTCVANSRPKLHQAEKNMRQPTLVKSSRSRTPHAIDKENMCH